MIDRNLVHKNVIEMFPDLDLTEIIQRYGHATSEQLASIIIDRMAQIPKKRGTKRKATENDEENDRTENALLEDSYAIENDEDLGDLLIDKFLSILIGKIKSELRQLNESGIGPAGFMNKRNFIMNQFNCVRVLFIEQMLDLFEHSLVPTSIACFLAENNFSGKLQRLAPGLSQNFWLKNGPPLARKRPPNMQPILAEDFPAEIYDEFGRYIQLMHNYRKGEYAELLTADLKLNQQYNLIRWERPEPEEKIECLVCYELFPLRRITYCSSTPAIPKHAFLANKSVSMNKENVPVPNMETLTPKMDKPGTSNAPKYVTPNTKIDKPGTSNAAKISYEGSTWFAFSSPTDLMLKRFNFLKNNSFANKSVSMNKENVPETKMGKPGPSNAPNYINISKMNSPLYTSTPYMYKKPGISNADNCKKWFKLEDDSTLLEEEDSTNGLLETSIIDVGEEEQNPDPSTHPFCRDCIRGQAQAATEQQPLAEGGVGLCCMVPDCKNPILYSDIRSKLSKEICKKLDERIMQENVAKALLPNLERCKRCNYAVQMEVDKKINKVFHCLQCDAKFCRICEQDWDDNHFGISCEELEQKLQRERKDRNLEKQLNEAVIRKCPSCGVAFMKDQGCNKMTCRCGMTMCYICRAEKIDYKHYCQHLRDPSNPNWKCKDCKKTCLLYEDAGKKDEQLIAQIRQEAAADGVTNPQQEKPTTSKFRRIQIDPPSPHPYAPAPRRTHSH